MKKNILLVIIFLACITLMSAQKNKLITGNVFNIENRKLIKDVLVTVKDTKILTTTNSSGHYKIKVPIEKNILVFVKEGFETQEVKIDNTKVLYVVMKKNVVQSDSLQIVDDKFSAVEKEMLIEDVETGEVLFVKIKSENNRQPVPYQYLREGDVIQDGIKVEHNTEEYDVINENEFKAVINEPLSTFSVDVDKASYSNVRRFLNDNRLPNKDAVRIEEMINYFSYKYDEPKKGEPFSINIELGKCPWNKTHDLLRIGLKGKNINMDKSPSSNLVFLLDVSGSMNSSNKLPLLKSAFKVLLDNLQPSDRVAIVVYAGAAGCVLESTSCDDKQKILDALNKLSAGGSTAGGAGIKLAYKIAKDNFIKNGNNRIILATDGDFNIGASSDAEMVRLIEEKRNNGIFLTVLGFGMGNYKDAKMEQISNAGNGNYAYIDNILEAKKVLGTEMLGTLFTIAKDVKFQIEFNPGKVKAYRLIGYENRMLNKEDFNDDKKDAGEIGANHTVTALYEIIPAGSKEEVAGVDELDYQKTEIVDSKNLMTVKLRYKEPDKEDSKLINNKIEEKDIRRKTNSTDFLFAASVAEFGLLLRDSKYKAQANYDSIIDNAKSLKGEDSNGYRAEFIKLVEIAKLLTK